MLLWSKNICLFSFPAAQALTVITNSSLQYKNMFGLDLISVAGLMSYSYPDTVLVTAGI